MIATLLALVLGAPPVRGVPPEGGNYRSTRAQPPRDTRTVATAPSATIAGVVTTDDAQPRPLRRARVMVNGPALPLTETVITADDGTFAIAVPAGTFEISAAKEAYVQMGMRPFGPPRATVTVTVAAGQTRRIPIRLSRGAVITGTVLDVDGQPAQGIAVTAFARRYDVRSGDVGYLQIPVPVLPTDDRGTYRIYGLPAGEYLVAAQPDPIGTPAASLRPIATMARGAPGRRAMGPAQVFFPSATDLDRAARIAVRAGEERSGVDVQLQYVPLSTVSGTATTATGWSPAEVAILRVAEVEGATRTTHADDSGRFSFANVPAGHYRFAARSSGPVGAVSTAVGELTIDGDDVDTLALSLQPGLRISGLVVFRGDTAPPAFGKSIATPVPLTFLLNRTAMTVPMQIDGARFTIEGLARGPFRMSGSPFGLRTPIGSWWLQSIVANGVELLDASLDVTQNVSGGVAVYSDRASEVSGRVTNADGAPLSGTTVVAFSADRAAWFNGSRRIVGVFTDRDGKYSIRNLPPGDYRLAATPGLERLEWFDPVRLEELLRGAMPLTIAGTEQKAVDLRPR